MGQRKAQQKLILWFNGTSSSFNTPKTIRKISQIPPLKEAHSRLPSHSGLANITPTSDSKSKKIQSKLEGSHGDCDLKGKMMEFFPVKTLIFRPLPALSPVDQACPPPLTLISQKGILEIPPVINEQGILLEVLTLKKRIKKFETLSPTTP
ncbi:hypothetical protein FOCC_FOCC007669 [Frankliniella occidentalis]|nr:hypothetical protein FOCC_FOCC007669 [Frankliniella occidentalis]